MIYYVKSGDLEKSVSAEGHREAAVIALKGSSECLGELVMVNEECMSYDINDDSVLFLSKDLLNDCCLRIVN